MRSLLRVLRGTLVVLLALAAVLATAVLSGPGGLPWAVRVTAAPGATPTPPPPPPAPEKPRDRPTPGIEAAVDPLGTPRPAPLGGGEHAFTSFQRDGVTPVAYDPCRPVHYTVNPAGAPAGGEELIHSAVRRIAVVTGLVFVFDGPTDEPLAHERAVFQPDRYGDRWAPVLIGWQSEAENPDLAGDVVGQAGSSAVSLGDGPRVFVTGTVSLDGPQSGQIMGRRGGATAVESVVLHELGHLVGLAHVEDATELMYPEAQQSVDDFGPGDLAGLARLGAGTCEPDL